MDVHKTTISTAVHEPGLYLEKAVKVATHTTDRSAAAATHAVDPTAVSFRWAAGTAVTHGERGLEAVVSFGWGRAAIIEAFGGGCGINSLRNECGDVDDPLALVEACFHVITHPDW